MSSQRTYWIDTPDDARWVFSQPERADVDHPGELPGASVEPLSGEWAVAYERSVLNLRMIAAQMVGDEDLFAELSDAYVSLGGVR